VIPLAIITSKNALKALFSPKDNPVVGVRVFTHAIYFSQDYNKHFPTLILDGQTTPRVYSIGELYTDLKELAESNTWEKQKSYQELILFFYSPEEIKLKKLTHNDLFAKCTSFVDASTLPIEVIFIELNSLKPSI